MGSYHDAGYAETQGPMRNTKVINTALSLIQELAASADEFERAEIQHALRKIQYSLEAPFETVMRMSLDV